MKKLLGVLALGVLVGVGVGLAYRSYSAKQATARVDAEMKAMVDGLQRQSILKMVAGMQQYIGPEGRALLKGLADKYPTKGIGIGYAAGLRDLQNGVQVWSPRVEYVFRGSPAESAGIKPGDWLLSIGGEDVYETCVEKAGDACPSLSGRDSVVALLKAAEGRVSEFQLQRGSETVKATLSPALYGQEIHDFTAQRLDGYYKYLDQMAPQVAEFAKKVEAADSASTDALLAEAKALFSLATLPFKELDDFFQTRIILPPPATEARPQL